MIRYDPGRARGSEWVPGRWEINAGVACAATTVTIIAACIIAGSIIRTEAIGALCGIVGFATLILGAMGTHFLICEWLPVTGYWAAYRRMRRREHDAYIRYLERKVLER